MTETAVATSTMVWRTFWTTMHTLESRRRRRFSSTSKMKVWMAESKHVPGCPCFGRWQSDEDEWPAAVVHWAAVVVTSTVVVTTTTATQLATFAQGQMTLPAVVLYQVAALGRIVPKTLAWTASSTPIPAKWTQGDV